MIKVIIADDQELIRQSLQIVLDLEENIKVLDAVANGNEVLEAIKREEPDVILCLNSMVLCVRRLLKKNIRI